MEDGIFLPVLFMKNLSSFVRGQMQDFRILLRNIPSLVLSVFILSLVCANLLANKELISTKYVVLDCGFFFSWIMFLCMDIICKRWGASSSIKVSLVALVINLAVCLIFALLAKTPGKWGEFYATENMAVNDALNATFGGSWYIVLGSATAFLVSSVVNGFLNGKIASKLKKDNFLAFAIRSYISTLIAQFTDNFIFAVMVSKVFFGWTWTQVFICSAIGSVFELLCEVLFSGLGYKIVRSWEKDKIGQEYLTYISNKTKAAF